jgi:hypothetical protein
MGAVPVTLTGLEPATSPIPGEQGRSIPLELQRHHDLHDRLWRRKGYEFTRPLLGRTECHLPLASSLLACLLTLEPCSLNEFSHPSFVGLQLAIHQLAIMAR